MWMVGPPLTLLLTVFWLAEEDDAVLVVEAEAVDCREVAELEGEFLLVDGTDLWPVPTLLDPARRKIGAGAGGARSSLLCASMAVCVGVAVPVDVVDGLAALLPDPLPTVTSETAVAAVLVERHEPLSSSESQQLSE